jgi:hypothetical protein
MDGPAALPPEEQYTYIFSGLAQMIDGILLSPALAARVDETMILHTNADFPYTLAADSSTAGLPYQFSDHDTPLLLLNFQPEPPPPTEAPPSATTAIPQPATAVPLPTVSPEPSDEAANMPTGLVLGLVGGAAVIAIALFAVRKRLRS